MERKLWGASGSVRGTHTRTHPHPSSPNLHQALEDSRVIMITLCLAVQPGLSWGARGLLLSGGRKTFTRIHTPHSEWRSRPWALRACGSRRSPRVSAPRPSWWLLMSNSRRFSRFWEQSSQSEGPLGYLDPHAQAFPQSLPLTFALVRGHRVAGRLLGLTRLHRGVWLAGCQEGD